MVGRRHDVRAALAGGDRSLRGRVSVAVEAEEGGQARVVGAGELELSVPHRDHDRRGQTRVGREDRLLALHRAERRLELTDAGLVQARTVGDPDGAVLEIVYDVLVTGLGRVDPAVVPGGV